MGPRQSLPDVRSGEGIASPVEDEGEMGDGGSSLLLMSEE